MPNHLSDRACAPFALVQRFTSTPLADGEEGRSQIEYLESNYIYITIHLYDKVTESLQTKIKE